jgi:hypothetical protein
MQPSIDAEVPSRSGGDGWPGTGPGRSPSRQVAPHPGPGCPYEGGRIRRYCEIVGGVDVELWYFDGCPNWLVARDNLIAALAQLGSTRGVRLRKITSARQAKMQGIPGSPTIRIDDCDPFVAAGASGLTCRLYQTPDGLAGAPTVGQLVEVLAALA